jgi:hypothetical protein
MHAGLVGGVSGCVGRPDRVGGWNRLFDSFCKNICPSGAGIGKIAAYLQVMQKPLIS